MKITQKNVIYSGHWDEFVQKIYGKPYCFQQQAGCRTWSVYELIVPDEVNDFTNDTLPEIVNGEEMGVSFKAWLERDPKQPLRPYQDETEQWLVDIWWERNFYPDVRMIANDLHAKGLLPAGEYLIIID